MNTQENEDEGQCESCLILYPSAALELVNDKVACYLCIADFKKRKYDCECCEKSVKEINAITVINNYIIKTNYLR